MLHSNKKYCETGASLLRDELVEKHLIEADHCRFIHLLSRQTCIGIWTKVFKSSIKLAHFAAQQQKKYSETGVSLSRDELVEICLLEADHCRFIHLLSRQTCIGIWTKVFKNNFSFSFSKPDNWGVCSGFTDHLKWHYQLINYDYLTKRHKGSKYN